MTISATSSDETVRLAFAATGKRATTLPACATPLFTSATNTDRMSLPAGTLTGRVPPRNSPARPPPVAPGPVGQGTQK